MNRRSATALLNRRFCAALLLLGLSGAVGAIPSLRAASDGSEQSTEQGTAHDQQKQQTDPPLPPLPENNKATAPASPVALPWAGNSSAAAGEAPQAETDNKQRVLLHRNGRLFQGELVNQGDRWIVKLEYGEVELKKSEVDFVGRDVAEVYQHLQAKVEPGSIDRRLELAAWCAAEKLLKEAEQELAVAQSLMPGHPKIPLIARQIQLAQNEPNEKHDFTAEGPGVAASFKHFEKMARNLPAGAVETFTEHVQPLLMNSCATAGCHAQGSPRSSFQIQRFAPSQGATQRLTQQNLRAALRYVNPDAMEESELLTLAIAEHGGSRTPPISSTDSAQFETLARWVVQVVGKPAAAPAVDTNTAPQQAQGRMDPRQAGGLPPQQPVVRTSDEIRALLSGHSFVEQYDKRHPKQEMLQYGLMGQRPAASVPEQARPPQVEAEMQGVFSQDIDLDKSPPAQQTHSATDQDSIPFQTFSNDGTGVALGNGAGTDEPRPFVLQNPKSEKLTAEEQALFDEVTSLPLNHIRVGAGDQQRQELHAAELGTFQPKDPFDPAVFNRRFGTRPPSTARSAPFQQPTPPRSAYPQPGGHDPHRNGQAPPPAMNNNVPPRG